MAKEENSLQQEYPRFIGIGCKTFKITKKMGIEISQYIWIFFFCVEWLVNRWKYVQPSFMQEPVLELFAIANLKLRPGFVIT